MRQGTKEQKLIAVSRAILEVIEQNGLDRLTHSEVSRRSGVSRAWIYEYVGKEKAQLIGIASDVFASFFARSERPVQAFNPEALQMQFSEAAAFAFQSALEHPMIIHLYFRYRGTRNPIGDAIERHEKQWTKHCAEVLRQVYPLTAKRSLGYAHLVLAARLGFAHRIVTSRSPASSLEEALESIALIHEQLGSGLSHRDS